MSRPGYPIHELRCLIGVTLIRWTLVFPSNSDERRSFAAAVISFVRGLSPKGQA